MPEALGAECRLCEILPVAGMARSSCGYARNAQAGGEAEGHAAARKAAIEASGASGGTCGCWRVQAARRGRPSQDPPGQRWPLLLAGMDKDMRRERPGQVDAGELSCNLLVDSGTAGTGSRYALPRCPPTSTRRLERRDVGERRRDREG